MKSSRKTSKPLDQIRQECENDFWEFMNWINPHYIYGEIHEECCRWFGDPNALDHQLLLMPRAHLKSHLIAGYCCWQITRDPTTTMVYLSAGQDLAKAQMMAIKGMFTCDAYTLLWPEMLNPEEGKRTKWSSEAINVDHPIRKEMGIRDHSLIIKTVGSNAIGLHCSHLLLDDVVVPAYAYSETGRSEVKRAISQFASILNPGGMVKAVGTRYHPEDAYFFMKEAREALYDEATGQFDGEKDQWDIKEYVIEDAGDGTGKYLWPRAQHPVTMRWEGFDPHVWSSKRATYFANSEHAQFYAQYYNDPNDPDSHRIHRDMIQYYHPKNIVTDEWTWFHGEKKLNIFAGMDLAWTDSTKSDYTAIAVIGVDEDGHIYVLDLERFKARGTEYFTYYKAIADLHNKWGFKKLRVESNSAGKLIAEEIKSLIRRNGDSLAIDAKATTSHDLKKAERHAIILETRFQNQTMHLKRGGIFQILEEEVLLERPPHDDLADALCGAIEISFAPGRFGSKNTKVRKISTHSRFGGRVF